MGKSTISVAMAWITFSMFTRPGMALAQKIGIFPNSNGSISWGITPFADTPIWTYIKYVWRIIAKWKIADLMVYPYGCPFVANGVTTYVYVYMYIYMYIYIYVYICIYIYIYILCFSWHPSPNVHALTPLAVLLHFHIGSGRLRGSRCVQKGADRPRMVVGQGCH